MEIEETITNINPVDNEITLGRVIFSAKRGLILQAVKHFPPGTRVKAIVEYDEIKSLVKWEEEQWMIG